MEAATAITATISYLEGLRASYLEKVDSIDKTKANLLALYSPSATALTTATVLPTAPADPGEDAAGAPSADWRQCTRCEHSKPLDAFPINKGCYQGHEPRCKACKSELGKIAKEAKKKQR